MDQLKTHNINMEKLKTLKDIQSPEHLNGDGIDDEVVMRDDLKQSAINWIKAKDGCVGQYTIMKLPILTREWIMEFFNITEEDLK